MSTPAPVTSLRHYRILVVGYCATLVCLGIAVIDRAMRGQWWWLLATVVAMVWVGSTLVTTVRHRRPGSAAQQAARARVVDEESAQAQWSPSRLRELAVSQGLDLSTAAGRIELIKAVRAADQRLGLIAAKDLVDRVS